MNKLHKSLIALSLVPGLGTRGIAELLKAVRDTEEIFDLSDKAIKNILPRAAGLSEKLSVIRRSKEYLSEIEFIEKEKINLLSIKDDNYPQELKNIYDAPVLLYYRGELEPDDANAVAIVGSRECSLYGMNMAEKLARDLAQKGVTVVSGMAKGIDSAAHRGAISEGGRTIAVMGSGFKHIYPPEANELFGRIAENGAVFTEYPSDTMPHKSNFPRRNRIISGMAKGIVVVEAGEKSGAMITVDFALEQGKDVFAVPGRADLLTSKGTNLLIKNGAKLVMDAEDVLSELDLLLCKKKKDDICSNEVDTDFSDLTESEIKVLGSIGSASPVYIDKISEESGVDVRLLAGVLLKLEMGGMVKALAGKNYLRTNKKGKQDAS
ncbi:MAG: DNA-processing protein DprA [Candidatus Omnitrophica bacterium]|nr:DNA-processing protein DprA [Candidatus Omnitrophota bacterium]